MEITPEQNKALQVAAGIRYENVCCVLDITVKQEKTKKKTLKEKVRSAVLDG
tara:strand:+ start:1529 stop:1684 length:156 start_codon:yes stop_codon:yes gene_type:complete